MNYGGDRVHRAGERLIVESAVEMTDWRVCDYRKTAILIGASTWYVAEKEVVDGRRVRYLLERWPQDLHDIPGKTIYYDADYVRRRDEHQSRARILQWQGSVLSLLKPLLGLLPSGIKSNIEAKFGISSRSSTLFSIWLELLGFLLVGIVTWTGAYAGLRATAELSVSSPAELLSAMALAVLLVVDLIFRYGSYLREDRSPYGFCEWLCRRRPTSRDSSP